MAVLLLDAAKDMLSLLRVRQKYFVSTHYSLEPSELLWAECLISRSTVVTGAPAKSSKLYTGDFAGAALVVLCRAAGVTTARSVATPRWPGDAAACVGAMIGVSGAWTLYCSRGN